MSLGTSDIGVLFMNASTIVSRPALARPWIAGVARRRGGGEGVGGLGRPRGSRVATSARKGGKKEKKEGYAIALVHFTLF